MRSQAKEYHLVDGNDSSPLVSEDPDSTHSIGSLYFSSTSSSSSIFDKALWCSVTLLVISLVFNLMFTLNYYQFKPHGNSLAPSEYAGLYYDKPIPWDYTTDYGAANTNQTRSDELWEAYITGPGSVALTHEYTNSKGLPDSQEFPWDINRGVYLLSGYHSLHCIKKVRRAVVIAHRGGKQFDDIHHLMHCLDLLRQDTICHADDTPMYTTLGPVKDTGSGQTRQCRDWNILEAWAIENSACYGYVNEVEGPTHEIDRFKYCPPGSQFAPGMRKYFGLPMDWYEAAIESVPPY